MNDYAWLNEQWADLDEEGFPDYAVSDHGRVARKDHDHILTPARNQRGFRFVTLYNQGVRKQIMVSTLVAQHFLEEAPNEHMISVLHKDGDRDNNNVENLVWRPRWYINKYHRQFAEHDPYLQTPPITVLETGKTYKNVREAAVEYGVMAQDIEEAILHNTKVRFAQHVTFAPA